MFLLGKGPLIKIKYKREELVGLLLGNESISISVVPVEDDADQTDAFEHIIGSQFLKSLHEHAVYVSQQDVHQEEKAEDQEDYEEQAVEVFVVVSRHHHIREVSSGKQHEHLVVRRPDGEEGSETLIRVHKENPSE